MAFVKDFSTWYLRLSRERLRDHAESQAIFAYALRRYTLLMAPFTPFMSERIYQNLPNHIDSVHLESWPLANPEAISPELEKSMETVMQIVEKGHAARKDAGIRLRQPLASLTISEADLSADLRQLVADELNVKKIIVGQEFSLDTKPTPELIEEGTARDLMRDIQGARKKLGLSPSDKVTVELPSWPESWTEEIKKKVGATSLTVGATLAVARVSV
jgi:isoleucyl-tRNA synthetase